jgi:predicted metal-dependent enzyme (double-stranded beta helix superfamily)
MKQSEMKAMILTILNNNQDSSLQIEEIMILLEKYMLPRHTIPTIFGVHDNGWEREN